MDRETLRALLMLKAAPGIGDVRLRALLDRHHSPTRAVRGLMQERPESAAHLEQKHVRDRIEHALVSIEAAGDVEPLGYGQAGYPAALLELHDPPPLLLARGHRAMLERPAVALVGTRAHTEYGADVTRLFAEALAGAGMAVISGLAHGIDRVAHETTLAAGGATIAVVGSGIDVVYPPAHANLQERIAREGLLLSEFLPGEPALPHHFPQRNRIIAALSCAVVVVEAPERSGALITAEHATDLGRDVFAVPGPIGRRTSLGTNALIRDGAAILTDPAELLAAVQSRLLHTDVPRDEAAAVVARPQGTARAPGQAVRAGRSGGEPAMGDTAPALPAIAAAPAAAGPARAVWTAMNDEPAHVDQLAAATGLTTAEALVALLELEIRGYAQQAAGMRFSRPVRR